VRRTEQEDRIMLGALCLVVFATPWVVKPVDPVGGSLELTGLTIYTNQTKHDDIAKLTIYSNQTKHDDIAKAGKTNSSNATSSDSRIGAASMSINTRTKILIQNQLNSNNNNNMTTNPTSQSIQKDASSKSEIYQMHSNGLMLLHPQRSNLGTGGTKKSELITGDDASNSVNYHVWKKLSGKNNNQSSIADNEHFLETKLGNLPQIQEGKRALSHAVDSDNKNVRSLDRDLKSGTSIVEENNKEFNQYYSENNKKRKLSRSHRSPDIFDPLFDDEQPEEVLRKYTEKRRLQRLKMRYGKLYDRGIPEIPAIKPIPDIVNRIDKLEPLEHVPRFADFKSGVDAWPRFGVPELTLQHYPRFPVPKLDEFERIPGIPHIRPLGRGDEVTGDKRGFPVKNDDDFYDQELDEDVEHYAPITSPTAIPELTNIPDIQDIQDIPTIKPPAASARSSSSGGNGKMPVMDTINTKEGQETRVSA